MGLFRRRQPEQRAGDLAATLIALERKGRTKSLRRIDADEAMRMATVWGCIRLLAESVAGLPIDVYRRTPGGVRVPISPVPASIRNPSGIVSRSTWTYQAMVSLLLRGNAYGLVTQFDPNGWPLQIEIAHPDTVEVKQTDQFAPPEYRIARKPVPSERMLHLSAFNVPGSVVGLSPIQYAAQTIGISLSAESYGAEYFEEGGHPSGVLESDQPLTAQQAKEMKQRFKEASEGGDIVTLGAGLKFHAVQVSPGEAQFLEARQASAIDICQIFGVPPEMLGLAASGQSVTYTNREQRALDFVAFSLQWWLTRFEEVLTGILPRPQYVKYNVDAFLRADLLTRYQAHQLSYGKWKSANEIRALEDDPPTDGGDQLVPAGQILTKQPSIQGVPSGT